MGRQRGKNEEGQTKIKDDTEPNKRRKERRERKQE